MRGKKYQKNVAMEKILKKIKQYAKHPNFKKRDKGLMITKI